MSEYSARAVAAYPDLPYAGSTLRRQIDKERVAFDAGFEAGHREGAETMRARAADVLARCESDSIRGGWIQYGPAIAAIRALPTETGNLE